jgi:hypothetical protein
VQRAFHQGADRAVACQLDGVLRRLARIVAGGRDLERGRVQAGRLGRAFDRAARPDQERPGDPVGNDALGRLQRGSIARKDDADRRALAAGLAAGPGDERVEARMWRDRQT